MFNKFTWTWRIEWKDRKNLYKFSNTISILTSNDFENFKNVLQAHYNYLSEESKSVLFEEKFKDGYDYIIEFIFQNIKGKNGINANNVIEHEMKNYKKYTCENWNSFLINNVIFQMLFSNDIELNLNGIEETLEKIYKLKPEFKNDFEIYLKKPVRDIKSHLDDFKLFNILKGIKNFIIPKMDLIKDKNDQLDKINEKIEKIENIQTQMLFITLNDYENFKNIFYAHYDQIVEERNLNYLEKNTRKPMIK